MIDPQVRDQVPRDQFAEAESQLIYLSHEILWVEVIDTSGRVRAAITHRPDDPNLTKMPPSTVYINERWVLVDGYWYFAVPVPADRSEQ